MAIRQYIGARYVPRFLGTYSATTIYDALDVVDDGLGTSYIARKTTPAGTPLNDTNYWFVYGASSGAILDLQSRMGTAENDIDNLESTVNRLTTRKIIFVSDSYGVRTGSSGQVLATCIANFAHISNYYDVHKSGVGFTDYNIGETFQDILEDAAPNIPNKDTITDIIVMGGCNDHQSTIANIYAKMSDFFTYCRTTYPHARIGVAHTGVVWDNSTRNAMNAHSIPAYKLANQLGGYYINNSQYILHKHDLLQSDEIHPNATGVDSIAQQIANVIRGGTVDVNYYKALSATELTDSQIGSVQFTTIHQYLRNDTLIFKTGSNRDAKALITITFADQLTHDYKHNFGTVDPDSELSIPSGLELMGVYATITKADDSTYNSMGFIGITTDGKLYYHLYTGGLVNTKKLELWPIPQTSSAAVV